MHNYIYRGYLIIYALIIQASSYNVVSVTESRVYSLVYTKPRPIMLNFYLLHFWTLLKKFAYYTQYYAHDYCNHATVSIWLYYLWPGIENRAYVHIKFDYFMGIWSLITLCVITSYQWSLCY